MDKVRMTPLRIAPVVQQGGTQTMQQAIYLVHYNPCGANQLIFQEMGLTQIRYIDLKNYLDEILKNPEVVELFDQARADGTSFIEDPGNEQLYLRYLNSLSLWAQACFYNLPVPVNYYKGYKFRLTVYDASGAGIFDSYFPFLTITREVSPGVYGRRLIPLYANPYGLANEPLYKLCNARYILPYIRTNLPIGFDTNDSIFMSNQMTAPESTMATASLLVDTANARAFGIPRYGFSSRSNQTYFGGIGYHCANFIDVNTVGEETTLIESVFARLSLEEDTLFAGTALTLPSLKLGGGAPQHH